MCFSDATLTQIGYFGNCLPMFSRAGLRNAPLSAIITE